MITAVRKTVYAKSADLRNAATGARFGATARPSTKPHQVCLIEGSERIATLDIDQGRPAEV